MHQIKSLIDTNDHVFIELWSTLEALSVRYLMIGGFAVNIYGFNRSTAVIDLWVENTIQNRENLALALDKLKIAPKDVVMKIQFIPGWTQMSLRGGFPLDIITELKGMEDYSFDECLSLATWADIENIKVPFLHLNHLLTAKKAANRLKDRITIEELEKLIDFQKKNSSSN